VLDSNAGSRYGSYDIARDGRVVVIKARSGDPADPTLAASQVIVVQRWADELSRLAPAK